MRLTRLFSMMSVGFLIAGAIALHPRAVIAQQPNAAQPNAAQQEKRIALVIGNGAYAKEPLATAANDGGLIAQTLQAAGFDVVGARDLDGDTLRGTFRDFVKKAEESGPDTVAVVYLAGYGIQFAGENYFIPVDSTLSRDTDIPIEGLRLSDYMRQLSALPLKASVFIVDAAREQPFIEGGQIASGLALVEPDPHMLVAFNAAPGTVAPEETGSYGAYAQALAEMIRTGGLPLTEVFNRVRLRVNENTKGAQVPWDTQKTDAQFTFFDRAPDAPADPAADQVAALRDKPIKDLGAQDAYSAAVERDTLKGYEDFIGAYPQDPMVKRVRAIVAARREAITWRQSYRANTQQAYWSYLKRYPRGPHAADARRRLANIAAALEPPPTFDEYAYDVPPPPEDEIIYVDRPVLMFSDPEFDFAPPPPLAVYYLPPPPPDFIDLAPPYEPYGLFYLPRPIFIPIPIYIRPPRYLRPPRNNIIFANIHNRDRINNVINRRPPPGAARPGDPNFSGGPGGRGDKGGRRGQRNPAVQNASTATLPASVARRANLIQEGKAPVPASASIKPRERTRGPGNANAGPRGPRGSRGPGGPNALPSAQRPGQQPGAAPAIGARPGQPGQPTPGARPSPGAVAPGRELPKTNALPVPGAKGAPPVPNDRGRGPAMTGPNRGPNGSPRDDRGRPGARGPDARPDGPGRLPPGAARPDAGRPDAGRPDAGRPDAGRPDAGRPDAGRPGATRPGAGAPGTPAVAPKPGPAVTPPPSARPQVERPAPPSRATPPSRTAPSRAAPPPRMAPPPRSAPAARPAPPPRMAPRAAPPRAAPPRAAPPPRMAPPRAAPPRAAPPRAAPPRAAPPRAAPRPAAPRPAAPARRAPPPKKP